MVAFVVCGGAAVEFLELSRESPRQDQPAARRFWQPGVT
jgi:hypothetical protein